MNRLTKIYLTTAILILLQGCMPGLLTNEGREGLPTIEDFSIGTVEDEDSSDCQDGTGRSFEDVFLSSDLQSCIDECSEGEKVASEEEQATILEELKAGDISDEDFTLVTEAVEASQGICIEEIIRPNNAINFKNTVCGCQGSEAITLNNCASSLR